MKNPLTSKERRGLVAVAASALLCVSLGFVFRNCSPRHAPAPSVTVIDNDSVRLKKTDKPDKPDKSGKDGQKSGSRKSKKKKAPERVYPVREPLDQPCD